jgi:hypothetical protein
MKDGSDVRRELFVMSGYWGAGFSSSNLVPREKT